jgi:predicted RNase H-like HicB family nuclease
MSMDTETVQKALRIALDLADASDSLPHRPDDVSDAYILSEGTGDDGGLVSRESVEDAREIRATILQDGIDAVTGTLELESEADASAIAAFCEETGCLSLTAAALELAGLRTRVSNLLFAYKCVTDVTDNRIAHIARKRSANRKRRAKSDSLVCNIEAEQLDDGRWMATVAGSATTSQLGVTRDEAVKRAQSFYLSSIAERLGNEDTEPGITFYVHDMRKAQPAE